MPSKGFNYSPLFFQLSRKEILFAWGLVGAVFTLFILYVFEIRNFENMVNPGSLIKWSLIYGSIFSALIATQYIQKLDDLTDRFKAFTFIFVSILFFTPLIGSLLNRWGSYKSTDEKTYEIFEVEKIGLFEQNQTLKIVESDYFIFFFENNELEKIRLRNWIEEPQKGNRITLELHRGLLGWNWYEAPVNKK